MNFYDLVIKKWWICVLCSGALFLLVSLAGWVLWYSGNIEGLSLADDKKQGHISYAVDRIARTLSRKIRSHRYRSWPFHFKSLLMVFSVNEKQMLNQTVCESVTDLSKRFQSVTKLKRLPYYDQYSSFLYISSDCCLTEQCCLIGFQ